MTNKVYLSLGGNKVNSQFLLEQAFISLTQLAEEGSFKTSPFYLTSPVGNENQSAYINAMCTFETTLSLQTLWQEVQRIEKVLGKTPKPKWAPRPIDIDIIFYGSCCYQEGELEVPHPKWKERLFVLVPLSDLTATIQIQKNDLIKFYQIKNLVDHVSNHFQQRITRL